MTEGGGAGPQVFADFVAGTKDRLRAFDRIRSEAEQVTATETSEDGITVTVNAGGVPTTLTIDEAKAPPVAEIGAAVLRTMRAAQAKLAARVADAARESGDPDTDALDRITAVYRDRFPEPADEADTAAAETGTGRPTAGAEEDWPESDWIMR